MELKEYLKDRREDLKHQINDISADFVNSYNLTDNIYLCDAISEFADSNVSIYYYDIFEFAKNNFDDVNDAIDEFGFATDSNGRPDIIRTIQQGEYLANERMLYDDIEKIKELLVVNYLLDNLDDLKVIATTIQEMEDIVSDFVIDFNNDDIFSDLADAIDEKFYKEGANNEHI